MMMYAVLSNPNHPKYKLAIRPLDVPASRTLGLALRKDAPTPLAVRCFLDYLPYRN